MPRAAAVPMHLFANHPRSISRRTRTLSNPTANIQPLSSPAVESELSSHGVYFRSGSLQMTDTPIISLNTASPSGGSASSGSPSNLGLPLSRGPAIAVWCIVGFIALASIVAVVVVALICRRRKGKRKAGAKRARGHDADSADTEAGKDAGASRVASRAVTAWEA